MSLKRRNTSSPEPDDDYDSSSSDNDNDSPVSKRQRTAPDEDSDDSLEHPFRAEQPKSDPVYGQKGAFPGLDGYDDELFYGPPSDGLEYLRMVRSEAKGVPHLLVAPKPPTPHDHPSARARRSSSNTTNAQDDQEGGYYADGAYTAAPSAAAADPSRAPNHHNHHNLPKAQDYYYQHSLAVRFRLLRATLKCHPPLAAIQALPPSCLISLPPDSEPARSQWRYHLLACDPRTVQLACMDAESVLEVVKILTGAMAQILRSRSYDRVARFGAWAWGVLGRCRDRTELGSEEVAVLRELGKRAGELVLGVRKRAATDAAVSQLPAAEDDGADGREAVEGDGLAARMGAEAPSKAESISVQERTVEPDRRMSNGQDDAGLESAKERLRGALLLLPDETESSSAATEPAEAGRPAGMGTVKDRLDVDQQIRSALDMVLTIVGEFYGQRDLLDFRDVWAGL